MRDEWVIWIKGEKVYVSEEVFRAYMRAAWREEKNRETRMRKECSYEFMCENDFDGQADAYSKSIEDIIADKLLSDKLYAALNQLNTNERYLIESLYFDGKSERELADILSIPYQTVHSRKIAILKKLKKIL